MKTVVISDYYSFPSSSSLEGLFSHTSGPLEIPFPLSRAFFLPMPCLANSFSFFGFRPKRNFLLETSLKPHVQVRVSLVCDPVNTEVTPSTVFTVFVNCLFTSVFSPRPVSEIRVHVSSNNVNKHFLSA